MGWEVFFGALFGSLIGCLGAEIAALVSLHWSYWIGSKRER